MSDRIGVALTPMETRREVIVETALLAESLGYEVFSLAEGWAYDSTAMLSFIAARTQRIRLLPGVLSVWSRTPAVLAMGAATLHEISGGRAILGLGPSTRALTEGLHDVAFMRPADQLRNVATQVRCLLDGQRATTAVTGARPLRLGLTPTPELPIWIAATGDLTTQVVAEAADGWYPLFLTLPNLRSRGDEIASASGESKPVTVAAGPFVVAGPGARDIAASCLAWYICAMGDGYAKLIADQGYGDAVEAVISANPRPTPTNSTVPESANDALGEFTLYGTPKEVRRNLEPWKAVTDVLMAVLPAGMPWENIEATLRAVAG